jgi:hypothetical protein
MPLRTEWEKAISVPFGKLFEDALAFLDIKTLKLQAIDDLISKPIQRLAPPQRMSLGTHDHFPKQHPRQIVPRRPTPVASLVPHSLLPGTLFNLDFPL